MTDTTPALSEAILKAFAQQYTQNIKPRPHIAFRALARVTRAASSLVNGVAAIGILGGALILAQPDGGKATIKGAVDTLEEVMFPEIVAARKASAIKAASRLADIARQAEARNRAELGRQALEAYNARIAALQAEATSKAKAAAEAKALADGIPATCNFPANQQPALIHCNVVLPEFKQGQSIVVTFQAKGHATAKAYPIAHKGGDTLPTATTITEQIIPRVAKAMGLPKANP